MQEKPILEPVLPYTIYPTGSLKFALYILGKVKTDTNRAGGLIIHRFARLPYPSILVFAPRVVGILAPGADVQLESHNVTGLA